MLLGRDSFLSVLPASPDIRELHGEDLPTAFLVVSQLREHLDLEEFQRRVTRQRDAGYMLYGAFGNQGDSRGKLLGVLGMRPVATLARGDHLHVDDLVVDLQVRGVGIGKALLEFAELWASQNALQAVFLDSRQEVVTFYSTLGYEPHTATLMKKRISTKPNPRGE